MLKKITQKHQISSLILLIFLFAPLLWISQYNYPSGDDYSFAASVQKSGAVGTVKLMYLNWSGRYTSFLLQTFLIQHTNWFTTYQIVPLLVISLGFGSIFYFVRVSLGTAISSKQHFSFSVLMYAFLVSLTPDIATGFYWIGTGFQYLGAFFLTLLVLAMFIRIDQEENRGHKKVLSSLAVLLMFLLCGLNEISTLILIAILVWVNLFYLLRFKRIHTVSFVFLLFSLIFGSISFLAPGNFARAGVVEANVSLLKILAGSVALTFYLMVELVATTPLLPATLLFLLFLRLNEDKLTDQLSRLSCLQWYWIVLSVLCILIAINSLLFYSVGLNSLVDRVKNVYTYTIVSTWFFLWAVIFANLRESSHQFSFSRFVKGTLLIYLVVSLIFGSEVKLSRDEIIPNSNFMQRAFCSLTTESVFTNAYLDILSGRAARYAHQNQDRIIRLRNRKAGTIDLPLFSYVPKTIFIQDAHHPFGGLQNMSKFLGGNVKRLNYLKTGPLAAPKDKF